VTAEIRPLIIVYLVVFGGFACLFPLAFYCLVLASWNGRRRPLFVSGPADFAGVLLATSGFLIVGGPLILTGLYDAWRRSTLHGSFALIRQGLNESSRFWLLAWLGYFILVVGGAAWLLARRRAVSVIYNIDVADAHELVPETLLRLGVPLVRQGAGYSIEFDDGKRSGRAVVAVSIMPIMRHVTLRWSPGSGGARRRVEAEMSRVLAELDAPANPAAGWLLAAATGLFALLLMLLAMFVFQVWRMRG
jgi:hypothetical protein